MINVSSHGPSYTKAGFQTDAGQMALSANQILSKRAPANHGATSLTSRLSIYVL